MDPFLSACRFQCIAGLHFTGHHYVFTDMAGIVFYARLISRRNIGHRLVTLLRPDNNVAGNGFEQVKDQITTLVAGNRGTYGRL